MDLINVSIGLVLLMLANIIVGSYKAWAYGEFDRAKMWKGVKKAFLILVAFAMVYGAGYLNPDVLVITMGEAEVNIISGLYLGIVATFITYAKQVIEKLLDLIKYS